MISLSKNRLVVIVSSLILLATIAIANSQYLAIRWPQYGFTAATSVWWPALISTLLTVVAALSVPVSTRSPGEMICIILMCFVVVPAVGIICFQSVLPTGTIVLLCALLAGFTGICWASSLSVGQSGFNVGLDRRFVWALAAVWAVGTVVIFFQYRDILSFSGIEDTYEQRELSRASSIWMGYTQTYYLNVFSPALLAAGLSSPRRTWWAGVLGAAGFMLVYLITAQKVALLTPALMLGIALLFYIRFTAVAAAMLLGVATAVVLALLHFKAVGDQSVLAAVFIHRLVGIPGLALSQYAEFFQAEGFTYWSHVKGIGQFVAPPATMAAHPNWPNIGFLIGDHVLPGRQNNFNASFFASDGVAAAGIGGLFVISAAAGAYVWVLNKCAATWNHMFRVLAVIPIGMSLANGALFTSMLSFGGAFWLVLFAVPSVWPSSKKPDP